MILLSLSSVFIARGAVKILLFLISLMGQPA